MLLVELKKNKLSGKQKEVTMTTTKVVDLILKEIPDRITDLEYDPELISTTNALVRRRMRWSKFSETQLLTSYDLTISRSWLDKRG